MATRRQRTRHALLVGSLLLIPLSFYFFSPVVVLAGAAVGVATGSLLLFAGQAAASLVVGRAWCGWLCPVGALSEWLGEAQPRPVRGGRRDLIKWAIWVPWVVVLAVLVARAGGYARVDPWYQTTAGLPLAEWSGVIAYLGVMGLVVTLSLAAGRRAFCHYVCWMAPSMILGTRLARAVWLPGLRLAADPERCTHCARCDHVCPMGLHVQDRVRSSRMDDDECVLCGRCADHCPGGALHLGFGRGPH